MADPPLPPAYFITVQEMSECPGALQEDLNRDRLDEWHPPRMFGSNIARGEPLVFYCVQGKAQLLTDDTFFANYAVHHETVSTYLTDHDRFLVINYDAIQSRVGNAPHPGDSEDSDSDEDGGYIDWSELCFLIPTRLPPQFSRCSYATIYNGRHGEPTLRTQRPDQGWVSTLLPPTYHAPSRTTNPKKGAMNCDLPLAYALMAYTVPPENVALMIPYYSQSGRFEMNHALQSPGRIAQRGLVVRSWSCEGFSTGNDLNDYQDGVYGRMFA